MYQGPSYMCLLTLYLVVERFARSISLVCLIVCPPPCSLSQSDEEEIVDLTPEIRKQCLATCPKQQSLYDACVKRITASKEGDCETWFIELLTCADKCVAPKVFAATKGG
jgi:Ubiquinol-cytochrome C reductase hinge protein